jgi:hypothetical protein
MRGGAAATAPICHRWRPLRGAAAAPLRRRAGARRARQTCAPVPGTFPPPSWPLAVGQIDHTPVARLGGDEPSRRPLGRLSLTWAIAVYSRCLPGVCLS